MRKSKKEYLKSKKTPLILILDDDIRSGHNVGSILRTADAFLLYKKFIYMWHICCPSSHKDDKTALGSNESVRMRNTKRISMV